jgi:ATP phosphoribosyltransferase regulatory subunit
MVLRADITPQIARIAATRLAGAPRPLRLSYAGECLRVRPASPGTDRQVPQAGIELIGADSAAADAEVLLVAAEATAALGLKQLSLDLTLPTLLPALLADADFTASDRHFLSIALDRKDAAEVTRLGGSLAAMLTDLLLIAGPAAPALAALRRASLPAACRALAERLEDVVARLTEAAPDLRLTIDPLEFRGYRYHTGLAFSMFAPGCPEEIGRGGRYISGGDEPATGITLYADAVLRAAGPRAGRPTVFVPYGAPAGTARQLRGAGYATLAGLGEMPDDPSEAARLGCTHVLVGGEAREVKEDVLF